MLVQKCAQLKRKWHLQKQKFSKTAGVVYWPFVPVRKSWTVVFHIATRESLQVSALSAFLSRTQTFRYSEFAGFAKTKQRKICRLLAVIPCCVMETDPFVCCQQAWLHRTLELMGTSSGYCSWFLAQAESIYVHTVHHQAASSGFSFDDMHVFERKQNSFFHQRRQNIGRWSCVHQMRESWFSSHLNHFNTPHAAAWDEWQQRGSCWVN